MNRRHFLKQGSILAFGALAAPSRGIWASSIPYTFPVGANAATRTAIQFTERFSRGALLQGGCVAAYLAGRTPVVTSVLVQTSDVDALRETLLTSKRFGIATVHAAGNVLSFAIDTQAYQVQCMAPEQFAAELQALSDGSAAAFAHDALQFRLDNGHTADPLRAGGRVRLLRQSQAPETALGEVLEGLIASATFGLDLDPSFEQAQSNRLSASVQGPTATRTVRTFLKALPALAATMPTSTVSNVFRSPLLASAFAGHSGVKTDRIVNRYAQLRNNHSAWESKAALWLAAVSSCGTSLAATGWIDDSTPLRRQAFLAAASRASQIV